MYDRIPTLVYLQDFLSAMNAAMKNYAVNIDKKEVIDTIQSTYECCGALNFTDWFEIPWISGNEPNKKQLVCCIGKINHIPQLMELRVESN
jgi:hypothetical protein